MAAGRERFDTKARRAAQAEATRAALIEAARDLFVDKGYHDTGTEEIVLAAGVGRAVRCITTSPISRRCLKPSS